MTETRKKQNKPDDPNYAGGEDEDHESDKPNASKAPKQNNFPVDETDTGPTAPEKSG